MAWLTGWDKSKTITITGSTGGAQTDYQLKIDVPYDSDMKADFSDIRFTTVGNVYLPSWLESKTNSVSAVFVVKIPSIPVNPGTVDIRMYYDNPSAPILNSRVCGKSTFIDYDEFDQALGTPEFSTGRETAGAFWDQTSNKLYRLGGEDSVGDPTNAVHSIDVNTFDETVETETLPEALSFIDQAVAWKLSTRKAYIYGGGNTGLPSRFKTNKIIEYDPVAGTFTTLTETLPDALGGISVAYDSTNNVVYAFGGFGSGAGGNITSKKIFKHNLTTNSISTLSAELPHIDGAGVGARFMGIAYDTNNGYIYLYGGATSPADSSNGLNDSIVRFKVSDETITTLTETIPIESDSMTGMWVDDGNIYMFGGVNFSPVLYLDDIFRHDIVAATCENTGYKIPKAMDDFTVVWDSINNKGYAINCLDFQDTDNDITKQTHIWEINFAGDDTGTEYPVVTVLKAWPDSAYLSIVGERLKVITGGGAVLRNTYLVGTQMKIEYDYEFNAGSTSEVCMYVSTLTTLSVSVRCNSDTTKFNYRDGGSWFDTSLTYLQGQTYNMKYIIDNTAETYDWFIDDTEYASGKAYRDAGALVDPFYLIAQSVATGGIIYYDRVRTSKHVEPEPTYEFGIEVTENIIPIVLNLFNQART